MQPDILISESSSGTHFGSFKGLQFEINNLAGPLHQEGKNRCTTSQIVLAPYKPLSSTDEAYA